MTSLQHILFLITFTALFTATNAQFTPQTYPDPRTDPLACKVTLPGPVCDPSEILTPDERNSLMDNIRRLQQITANIHNSSPNCAGQNANIFIMIAMLDKLGTLPFEAVSIEKFTNQLRNKYLNYQDVGLCDTLVLIVNSRSDRQVFTVAGRDAKLSREVLQTAFHRNVGHFRAGNYGMGLEGMVQLIVSAYNSAHIVQVPSPLGSVENSIQTPSSSNSFREQTPNALGPQPSSSSLGQFLAHGVRQKPDVQPFEKFNLEDVPEEDRLWVDLMMKAAQRCGYDSSKISTYVRGIVDEAMNISLKLISDPRYNKIEEHSHNNDNSSKARDEAWEQSKNEFLDALYVKYGQQFPRSLANQCPVANGNNTNEDLNQSS